MVDTVYIDAVGSQRCSGEDARVEEVLRWDDLQLRLRRVFRELAEAFTTITSREGQ